VQTKKEGRKERKKEGRERVGSKYNKPSLFLPKDLGGSQKA
jgi:hypothetical protein